MNRNKSIKWGMLAGVLLLSACTLQPKIGGKGDGRAHRHDAAYGGHRHESWLQPPVDYADLRSGRWANLQAIVRGESLYGQFCRSCHGDRGRGDGPLAASLPHPPADLTQHFHHRPGQGDDYLFWRVSEGGKVEPFRSQQSVMPAFKSQLTVEDRWAVLAYVHAYFHLGLADWKLDQRGN